MLENEYRRKLLKTLNGIEGIMANIVPPTTEGIPDIIVTFKNLFMRIELKRTAIENKVAHQPIIRPIQKNYWRKALGCGQAVYLLNINDDVDNDTNNAEIYDISINNSGEDQGEVIVCPGFKLTAIDGESASTPKIMAERIARMIKESAL